MYIDIVIYPLVEKLVALDTSIWSDRVKQLNLSTTVPSVISYVKRVREHHVFKKHALKQEDYDNWMRKFDRMEFGVKA